MLSADDDAKAAALQWASEAAFGNTEVAAPKILGDIVESLVGAVYIDTNHDFDKTWQVQVHPHHDVSLTFFKGGQFLVKVESRRGLGQGHCTGDGGGGDKVRDTQSM